MSRIVKKSNKMRWVVAGYSARSGPYSAHLSLVKKGHDHGWMAHVAHERYGFVSSFHGTFTLGVARRWAEREIAKLIEAQKPARMETR